MKLETSTERRVRKNNDEVTFGNQRFATVMSSENILIPKKLKNDLKQLYLRHNIEGKEDKLAIVAKVRGAYSSNLPPSKEYKLKPSAGLFC